MSEGGTKGQGEKGRESLQTWGKREESEKKGINKEGEWEQSNREMLRSRSQNCPLILMFILSILAGVPSPQPHTASVAHSHWLCGSLEDKTVIKRDGNNTKESLWPESQTNCCFHPSSLSHSIVSKHEFAPSSQSCWLRFFYGPSMRENKLHW